MGEYHFSKKSISYRLYDKTWLLGIQPKHSLQNIVIELKKLNGKTVLDPTQIKRSNMVMVEVNTVYDSYGRSHTA